MLSFAFCLLLIPLLKRIGLGQNILSYVKEHTSKSGTPTMGGLAFIPAAVLACALLFRPADRDFLVTCSVGLAYLAVGFLDDILKKVRKRNLGLRAWQKFSFQVLVAVFAAVYAFNAGHTRVLIPFFQKWINCKYWIIPLVIFLFLATVNAVNLTDGLDGLAAGTSTPYFLFYGIFCLMTKGNGTLAALSFCLVGGLAAYLIFNVSKASVFMGDTGSLSLGGFAACIAAFSGGALFVPLVGLMFAVSVISVIVQVIYYKATGGKRVFLMAPIHHHFQQKGYSEGKISYAYSVITGLLSALCVLSVA